MRQGDRAMTDFIYKANIATAISRPQSARLRLLIEEEASWPATKSSFNLPKSGWQRATTG